MMMAMMKNLLLTHYPHFSRLTGEEHKKHAAAEKQSGRGVDFFPPFFRFGCRFFPQTAGPIG